MDDAEQKRIQLELQILDERGRYFWSWLKGERSYSRLHRECRTFLVDLRFLEATDGGSSRQWVDSAYRNLASAAAFLKKRDVEGGWTCLHAAQRYAIFGMDEEQKANRTLILKAELAKLSPWRAKAVEELLSGSPPISASRLFEATRLRDEHDSNQYHKIWLTADQLGVLGLAVLLGFLLLIPLMGYYHLEAFVGTGSELIQNPPSPWGFTMIITVLVLGMFGGAFSVAQSIITETSGAKIPERVANHWVTFIRALSGSVSGLAGYAFYRSKLINITLGDGKDATAIALAVGFLFGYAGERLIAKVADTIGASAEVKKPGQ